MLRHVSLLSLLLLVLSGTMDAQYDSTSFHPMFRRGIQYQIRTAAGETIVGVVRSEDADYVSVEDPNSHTRTEIRKKGIVSYHPFSDRDAYEYYTLGENKNAAHNMLSGSAMPMKAGGFSLQSPYLIYNQYEFSFSRHWAMQMGVLVYLPVSLGVKFSYDIGESTYLGGQGMVFYNLNETESGKKFIGYNLLVRITSGTTNRNITGTAGVIGVNGQIIPQIAAVPNPNVLYLPYLSGAAMRKFTTNFGLTAEAWYIPGSSGLITGAAVKLFSRSATCWTLGAFTLIQSTTKFSFSHPPSFLPYFSYAYTMY